AGAGDRENGEEGLARPGRQHDDAPPALFPPGLERLGLVREGVATGAKLPLPRFVSAGLVGVGNLLVAEMLNESAVIPRLGAMAVGARVELHARQRGEKRRFSAGDNEGAGVERQADGRFRHAAVPRFGPMQALAVSN